MIDYGIVESTVRPEPKVVDDFSVWVNSDIEEVTINSIDGISVVLFEYHQVRYDKDEYIKLISDKNDELNEVLNVMLGVGGNG